MKKIDLSDVTFIIPIRISHIDRLNNLTFLVNYLTDNFNTNIMIYESDTSIKISEDIINKVTHIFEYDDDEIFHRTKFLNEMLKKVTTKYVVNQDTDVFIPISSYIQSVKLLENGVDVVYPYNGDFVNFNRTELEEVSKTFNPIDYELTQDSYGGMIFLNTESYISAGGEDERFYGWGFEDRERIVRFMRLKYRVERLSNKLYHINHHRDNNASPDHPNFENNQRMANQMMGMKNTDVQKTIIELKKTFQDG